jgi:hypothetical protein
MKHLIYFLIAISILSCSPPKFNTVTTVDIYCDSCNVTLVNRSNDWVETPFTGLITGYHSISVNRFSNNGCLLFTHFQNYSTDTPVIYAIENNDTIIGNTDFCF